MKPLTDTSQTPVGNGILTPAGYNQILAGYVVGANAARGLISSPKLRQWANFYVSPADAAANPTANPPFNIVDMETALPVTVGDELDFQIDNGNNGEWDFGLAWIGGPPVQNVTGKIFSVEALGSTLLTADQWTPVSLTFQTSLEAGLYQVVGMYAHFNGAIAARYLFPGALAAIRPGVIAASTGAKAMPLAFRYGQLGIWGVFQAAAPPQIECLSTAATSSERFILDLIKGPTGLSNAAISPTDFGPPFSGNP